jgi:hypothetical protein
VTRLVSLRPQGRAEARRAKAWYEEQVPGLGGQFVRARDAAVAAITERPEAFPKVRRIPAVLDPPLSLLYLLSDLRGRDRDHYVHHQRRDPAR